MYDNGRLHRSLLAPLRGVLLSLALLASTFAPAARAQDVAGMDNVRAVYYDLLELFYRPVSPNDLLQAGWTALGADATRHSASAPDPLPDLPDDADAAFVRARPATRSTGARTPPARTATATNRRSSATAARDGGRRATRGRTARPAPT